MALDLQEAEELVHTRWNRQLLGGDIHHAAIGEYLSQPALDRSPVDLHLALGLDLLPEEPLRDPGWLAP